MYFKKYGVYPVYPILISYETQRNDFQVELLSMRRKIADIIFIYDIISGNITESNLLSKINLNVPDVRLRPRTNILFYIDQLNSPISKCSSNFNSALAISPNIDIFNTTRDNLKSVLKLQF